MVRTIKRSKLTSKPVYESEYATLYCGDSRSVVLTIPKVVSLIVTDPPYGIDYQSNQKKVKFDNIVGDSDTDIAYEVLSSAIRKFRADDQHMYVFGRFDLSKLNTGRQVELIWDKVGTSMGDLSSPFYKNFEYIQFARGNVTRKDVYGLVERKRKGAVLRCPNITGTRSRLHPTQKPVPLLRNLLESSSVFDDVVLDPFMGVGSTGVAAILEGRRFIGIEIDRKYVDIAISRIKTAEQLWTAQRGV
jgi:site-specific DNA-methyltransferase (adenine-specific)